MIPVVPAIFIATLTLAVADGVPNINVQPTCKAAAEGIIGLKQDAEACIRSEQRVRAQLVEQWTQFLAEDRASCARLATMGGGGTYTELLTCLELKRDARKLPKDTGPVGRGAGKPAAR